MRPIADLPDETMLIVFATPTGVIARGGPGVRTAHRGALALVVDDLGLSTASHERLRQILMRAETDPLAAVIESFDAPGLEIFVLIGPSGVIAGSARNDQGRRGLAVWADVDDGIVAIALAAETTPADWIRLPAGTAVRWGPEGPQTVVSVSAPDRSVA